MGAETSKIPAAGGNLLFQSETKEDIQQKIPEL